MAKTNFQPMLKRLLEKRGFTTLESVEKFNSFTMQRKDLLGVADYLAMDGKDNLLVQITSASNTSSHRIKIDDNINEGLEQWLNAGGRFWLVYFKKRGSRWHFKIEERLKSKWRVLTPEYIKD